MRFLYIALAAALIDGERGVTHAQARVAALFAIAHWPAEALDEEVSQALFGAMEVLLRVHREEDVVGGDATVERGDETREPFFSDQRVNGGVE